MTDDRTAKILETADAAGVHGFISEETVFIMDGENLVAIFQPAASTSSVCAFIEHVGRWA